MFQEPPGREAISGSRPGWEFTSLGGARGRASAALCPPFTQPKRTVQSAAGSPSGEPSGSSGERRAGPGTLGPDLGHAGLGSVSRALEGRWLNPLC